MRKPILFLALFISFSFSSSASDEPGAQVQIIDLGINPQTGLQEIRVELPDLPDEAKPLDMVLVPTGTFLMGSPPDEHRRTDDEGPQFEVTMDRPVYISKYTVTEAQWRAVMGELPSWMARNEGNYQGGDDYPVRAISWYEAARYCNRLGAIAGFAPIYNERKWAKYWWRTDLRTDAIPLWSDARHRFYNGFRMPTEAEWEYACRAGTDTRFSFGNGLECGDLNEYCELYDQNMWWAGNMEEEGRPDGPRPVGEKAPNSWGLYDMHGNINEWCHNWWYSYPGVPPENNAITISMTDIPAKVLRGGGYRTYAHGCRSAKRIWSPPNRLSGGLRLLFANIDENE